MVRNVVTGRRMAGSAIAAITVGGVALVCHILACNDSPMAWSPDGKQLAFVTLHAYEPQADLLLAGKHLSRLMVVHDAKELRILEETAAEMLCAPAFSPDGTRLSYLRIPLLSADALEEFNQEFESRKQQLSAIAPVEWTAPAQPGAPASAPTSAPALVDAEIGLPNSETLNRYWEKARACPELPAQLVTRNAKDGTVLSATPLSFPGLCEDRLLIAYLTLKPQYDPDGQWVYLTAGNTVLRVNPATSRVERVIAPAAAATLSPDGKVLAVFQDDALALIQTDGKKSLYVPAGNAKSMAGFSWTAAGTLVVLEQAEAGSGVVLRFLDAQGALLKTVPIDLPPREEQKNEIERAVLAVAPDGRHAVIELEPDVYFVTTAGELLNTWHSEDNLLTQPTFSPDSQRVALKLMQDSERLSAIVFFSPAGQELTRVPIPPIDPAATQPAKP